ncbi:hypothetical protein [Salipiger mucosus]|uniref:Uncharacterized protein n=1 Tax=Salipiger mucosus DSM 16094 TaxID=1123237 RepID=S9Q2X1_9RHOB|nr:hypothetical protein [Salipiger mucosus]EPX75646.1 hypothetical protein Salmuc_04564 [Salipiger mucosus DSM 16094]
MDVWTVAVALYLASTVVALFLTYQEQKRRGHKTPVYTVIGYVLCAVWPLVAAVMVIFYRPRKA